MKKITLSIALLTGIITAKAQDTTCTYFEGDRVIEFNFKTSKVLSETKQNNKFYDINIKYGDVLCLDLSDKKRRIRKVITTYFDGYTVTQRLKSKDNVYYSPQGASKVSVGRPKLTLKK